MKNSVLEMMKEKVESLWSAIQEANSADLKSALRKEYQRAYQTYQLQNLIVQGKA